jgi:hypothetical protein
MNAMLIVAAYIEKEFNSLSTRSLLISKRLQFKTLIMTLQIKAAKISKICSFHHLRNKSLLKLKKVQSKKNNRI